MSLLKTSVTIVTLFVLCVCPDVGRVNPTEHSLLGPSFWASHNVEMIESTACVGGYRCTRPVPGLKDAHPFLVLIAPHKHNADRHHHIPKTSFFKVRNWPSRRPPCRLRLRRTSEPWQRQAQGPPALRSTRPNILIVWEHDIRYGKSVPTIRAHRVRGGQRRPETPVGPIRENAASSGGAGADQIARKAVPRPSRAVRLYRRNHWAFRPPSSLILTKNRAHRDPQGTPSSSSCRSFGSSPSFQKAQRYVKGSSRYRA
jgi:hypothetical protein